MRVTTVKITIVAVPQIAPVAPYRSHLRTSSITTKGIVRVDTDAALVGWGELNVNFLPGLSGNAMQYDASQWLVGRDPLNIEQFHRDCPLETRLKSGLEMALWDVRGKAACLPLAVLLGGVIRPEIELAACMGIQSYERAGEIASFYVEQGYTTLKTKAGSDMDEDFEMARGIRDAVGDRLKLRIDPNRAYSPAQAAELAKRLEPFNLEYFEQPIAAEPLSTARWLRQQTATPIALNESVTDSASVWEILREEAAAFILPDTYTAGGVLPCVKIGAVCEAAGIPCIMHCGHDLGPKTAVMLHVAASCPAYSLANDSTYYGLEDDIITEPFQIVRGKIAVPNKPGLGVEVDPQKLKRYAVDG
ncbi:MAG: mandelate racemase/muconate lactonizing enzyme family protein [Planctomycetaceae bacterium]